MCKIPLDFNLLIEYGEILFVETWSYLFLLSWTCVLGIIYTENVQLKSRNLFGRR